MSAWFIKIFKLLRIVGDKTLVALNLTLGYLFIGLHQFFEFLSIYTGNEIIYKTGLVLSITAMYFNIKASEKLLKKNLGLIYVMILLLGIAIHIYTRTMTFENAHFYVRGFSHFYWGALWILFFLYWNFIHYFATKTEATGKKLIKNLPYAALNISFFMAASYSYLFALLKKKSTIGLNPEHCLTPFLNFEIVFDAPSIWCCFATIQGYFLYRYIKNFWYGDIEIPIETGAINTKKALFYAIGATALIWLTLPFFSALSVKMILK